MAATVAHHQLDELPIINGLANVGPTKLPEALAIVAEGQIGPRLEGRGES